jgi:hypothetical protein
MLDEVFNKASQTLQGVSWQQNFTVIRKIDGARRNRIGFTFPELYGGISKVERRKK